MAAEIHGKRPVAGSPELSFRLVKRYVERNPRDEH